jgi:hypothetical protein
LANQQIGAEQSGEDVPVLTRRRSGLRRAGPVLAQAPRNESAIGEADPPGV